jgi:hypothetical protein
MFLVRSGCCRASTSFRVPHTQLLDATTALPPGRSGCLQPNSPCWRTTPPPAYLRGYLLSCRRFCSSYGDEPVATFLGALVFLLREIRWGCPTDELLNVVGPLQHSDFWLRVPRGAWPHLNIWRLWEPYNLLRPSRWPGTLILSFWPRTTEQGGHVHHVFLHKSVRRFICSLLAFNSGHKIKFLLFFIWRIRSSGLFTF